MKNAAKKRTVTSLRSAPLNSDIHVPKVDENNRIAGYYALANKSIEATGEFIYTCLVHGADFAHVNLRT